jgi:hypothetical protein
MYASRSRDKYSGYATTSRGRLTRRSRMTLTDDWPPSSVRISYTPILLESGEHWAEIRFHTRERRTISYVWGFIFTPGRSEGRIRLVWGTWSSDR